MFEGAQRRMERFGTLRNQRPEGKRIVRIESLVDVGVMNVIEFGYALRAVNIQLGRGLNGVVCPLTLLEKL